MIKVEFELFGKLEHSEYKAIHSKLRNEHVSIVCVPQKGMFVELRAFQETFRFTDEEIMLLEDSNVAGAMLKVVDLIIYPNHLQVRLAMMDDDYL